jgi:vancomycin resistance protein YoaR
MVKEKHSQKTKKVVKSRWGFYLVFSLIILPLSLVFLLTIFFVSAFYHFENKFKSRIYPGVKIDNILFGGGTKEDVYNHYSKISKPYNNLSLTLIHEDKIATISGEELEIKYDAGLISEQAYMIGRSGHFFSDIYQKWQAAVSGINLTSILTINSELIDQVLEQLGYQIDIPSKDALFKFENNKVTAFTASSNGKKLNQNQAKKIIMSEINMIDEVKLQNNQNVVINLPVETLIPEITTENSNNYGIREEIGVGTSKFRGSISSRIHNIALAASKINGQLIPPGNIYSFNDSLGDVSAATGYQPAYIIKDGRTVLGDGGGVCQVSTTIFRAALSAGLKIIERHPHSYRVSYYEQDSGPGIDATVFSPSYDLRFENNTGHHILIQAETDKENYALTFRFFGTKDGRIAEIGKPIIYSQSSPPPDVYQDDPTLPVGVVKQVDWKAWGAKVGFTYKVTRNGEVMYDTPFYSNYQPWQAVFLKGTKT